MSWTPEKEKKLKELWKKGHTASQIAAMLGDTTRNAVIGKAHRLNLSAKIKPRANLSNNKKNILHPEKITRRERRNKFKSLLLDKNFEPAKNLTLEELTEKTCKYMMHKDQDKEGHPDDPNSFFCGRDTVEKYSYCVYHMGIVWQTRDKKDELLDKDQEVPKFIEKKIKSA